MELRFQGNGDRGFGYDPHDYGADATEKEHGPGYRTPNLKGKSKYTRMKGKRKRHGKSYC
jgi:hypothetical protein